MTITHRYILHILLHLTFCYTLLLLYKCNTGAPVPGQAPGPDRPAFSKISQ